MENQSSMDNKSQLPNLINYHFPEKKKTTSVPLIILVLLIFWPLGFYLLWKEKRLHIWFPNLLIALGILSTLSVLSIMFFVFPELTRFYGDFGVAYNQNNSVIFASFILVLSLIGAVIGFVLRKKVSSDGPLRNLYVLICLAFFALQFISTGVFITTVIQPIYNLTP